MVCWLSTKEILVCMTRNLNSSAWVGNQAREVCMMFVHTATGIKISMSSTHKNKIMHEGTITDCLKFTKLH